MSADIRMLIAMLVDLHRTHGNIEVYMDVNEPLEMSEGYSSVAFPVGGVICEKRPSGHHVAVMITPMAGTAYARYAQKKAEDEAADALAAIKAKADKEGK